MVPNNGVGGEPYSEKLERVYQVLDQKYPALINHVCIHMNSTAKIRIGRNIYILSYPALNLFVDYLVSISLIQSVEKGNICMNSEELWRYRLEDLGTYFVTKTYV